MVSIGTAKLAGLTMSLGILALAGNDLAFAQQPSSCGEQAYVYNVGCLPLDTAQLVGAIMVASIAVFATVWGVAERQFHMIPNFK